MVKLYGAFLTLLLCTFPPFLYLIAGIYVLMYVHIWYTFCKILFLTILLIFSFSFALYMAFYDPTGNFVVSGKHFLVL
jgi:hypothetical protein